MCPLWGLEPTVGDSGEHLGAGEASSQVERLGLPPTPGHLPVGSGSQRHSRVQPFSRGQICPDPALRSQFQARAFLPELSTSIQKRRRRAPLSCPLSPFPLGPESLSGPQGPLLLVYLHHIHTSPLGSQPLACLTSSPFIRACRNAGCDGCCFGKGRTCLTHNPQPHSPHPVSWAC